MENHHFPHRQGFMCILSACEWCTFLPKKTPNDPQGDWKMAIADCTCRAHVSNSHYEPPCALRRWVFATKCSYTALSRCILSACEWCIFFQIRKIDGSPSVLHLFRRYWMILKAEMLLYTRVVVSIALQQRWCAKKIPEHDFVFWYFWWWWGMQYIFFGWHQIRRKI